MKHKKNSKKEIEKPIRLDFDTHSREIIEVYELSPDGSQVRTSDGWVDSGRDGVITQRSTRDREYMTDEQIEMAVHFESELLREKKYKDTGSYLVAKKYPIREWLTGE